MDHVIWSYRALQRLLHEYNGYNGYNGYNSTDNRHHIQKSINITVSHLLVQAVQVSSIGQTTWHCIYIIKCAAVTRSTTRVLCMNCQRQPRTSQPNSGPLSIARINQTLPIFFHAPETEPEKQRSPGRLEPCNGKEKKKRQKKNQKARTKGVYEGQKKKKKNNREKVQRFQ